MVATTMAFTAGTTKTSTIITDSGCAAYRNEGGKEQKAGSPGLLHMCVSFS
jgi:hypothetical protein